MTPAQAEQHARELRELWEQEHAPTKEEVRRALGWRLIPHNDEVVDE